MARGSTRNNRRRRFAWEHLPDPELLDLRLCDLEVGLEGTWLEAPIEEVLAELAWRDLRIRPSFWLSEEWFCPDGVVGVALPFFLAHPRLVGLERRQMLEVEGGTHAQCLKLLRHEIGHALHHAFQLQRRRRFTNAFGSTSRAYPKRYRPNPASRRYVLHLDYWYAQAHPFEDFAETFAVWLSPSSRWRKVYQGWPALRKLEYVDELMDELAGQRPSVRKRARVEPLADLKQTLRAYYQAKRARFRGLTSAVYDEDLRRLFRDEGDVGGRRSESAVSFLRRNRARIRRMVAQSTGKHEYALDVVLGEMLHRCRELRLRATGRERALLVDLAILVSARSVEYVHRYRGRDWHAM
ncbi:MAG: putative zinc-binding metallopeptidase [Myxococcales bacterium]|nr:putative zinc-binding metallopeptidase [Myxococcales bacterium]